MPNKQNQLVPIFDEKYSINYQIEESEFLNNSSVQQILNAWSQGSLVDGIGQVWIDEDCLSSIWRTDKSTASYFTDDIREKDKLNFNGKNYLKYSSVIYRLNELIQSPIRNKRREYLKVSDKIGTAVRDSTFVHNKQLIYTEHIEDVKKKLKSQRIKTYTILLDELTLEPLDIAHSEFHHIRRQSIYPNLISFIWNGLIINKQTHHIITQNNISDEYDLEALCIKEGWSLDWLNQYISDLNSHVSKYL